MSSYVMPKEDLVMLARGIDVVVLRETARCRLVIPHKLPKFAELVEGLADGEDRVEVIYRKLHELNARSVATRYRETPRECPAFDREKDLAAAFSSYGQSRRRTAGPIRAAMTTGCSGPNSTPRLGGSRNSRPCGL